MSYESFIDEARNLARDFKALDPKVPVRIISHLDSDGLCACAILMNALDLEKRKYSVSILPQLSEVELASLAGEGNSLYIFSDFGSGHIETIIKRLAGKDVFILDHHQFRPVAPVPGIRHLNPLSHGIDGAKEIAGSGVAFIFARELSRENDKISHLPLIGAIGDLQEDNGFQGLNRHILEIAKKNGKIDVRRGLRLFGAETKPLHKLLAYSTEPYIPEVGGSTSRAIQYLQGLGIDPKLPVGWKKFSDLTEEEKGKLVAAISKGDPVKHGSEIMGQIYEITSEGSDSPVRDIRDFSTMLNACGRMGKASLGIAACLNDHESGLKAVGCMEDYRKEITNALSWYYHNLKTGNILSERGYVIINAKDSIKSTIIGTLASILSKSADYRDDCFILAMSRMLESSTKISFRYSGNPGDGIDLRDIIKTIVARVGGEAGGHRNAAGAIIPSAKEDEFIQYAAEILKIKSMEENIA